MLQWDVVCFLTKGIGVIRLFYSLVFSTLLLGFSISGALAADNADLLKQFEKEMPVYELEDTETFKQRTKLEEVVPVGVKGVSYKVRIPSNWEASESISLGSLVISDQIFSSVGKYFGEQNTDTPHSLTVRVIGLPYQMTAKNWMMKHLLENSYNVQGFKVHDDKRVECLYVRVGDNTDYVTRAVAQINGKNLVFAEHSLPVSAWTSHRSEQAQVLSSFDLIYKTDKAVENIEEHNFAELAQFNYPVSWSLKTYPLRSVEKMHAEINNYNKTVQYKDKSYALNGKIYVKFLSEMASKGIEQEVEALRNKLVDSGLFVQDELEDHTDYIFDTESDVLAKTHVYHVVDKHGKLQEMEYWITIRAHGDHYFYTTLLTPVRGEDFFKWSRNTEAYKLVTKSFGPKGLAQKKAQDE